MIDTSHAMNRKPTPWLLQESNIANFTFGPEMIWILLPLYHLLLLLLLLLSF